MIEWPEVRLGELFNRVKEEVLIDELQDYTRLTIHLNGKGIGLRDRVSGHKIGTKRQFLARAGQLVLSKIDARNGAFGILPTECDKAIITGNFWAFKLEHSRIDAQFFEWLTKTPQFVDYCIRASEGTTNRRYLQEGKFLEQKIRLPTLSDQRRIVERVEEFNAKIAEAHGLRKQTLIETQTMLGNSIGSVFQALTKKHGRSALSAFRPHVTSGPRNWAKHYQQEGERFYRAQDIGADWKITSDNKVFITPPPGQQGRSASLKVGDLMLVITGATVGRCAVFEHAMEPGFVSQHVAICRLPSDDVDPRFVLWGLRGPEGQAQLLGQRYGQGKPGLNLGNIRSIMLPFPSVAEQRLTVSWLDGLQRKVDSLKQLQEETSKQLEALFPSLLNKAFNGEL